ncbi:hypothetical protein QJQ45_013372 [Haematococcus lacustris]|nr:hypothetical protein QJQ45_013372 [Haematococcus lacustris]
MQKVRISSCRVDCTMSGTPGVKPDLRTCGALHSGQARSQAAASRAQATNRDLQAEVQRLRDVEQSLMCTVDGLQGDLDDLQAAHQRLQDEHAALQQVASRAAATNHSLRAARRSLQGQVHIYRSPPLPTHLQAEAAAADFEAAPRLSGGVEAVLHLETGVSRRALSKCRQYFVSERCFLSNPHRPGKTSTVGREFHIVSTYMQRNTLAVNMGEYGGVVARMSELLQSKGQAGCIRAQPCYSHGTHNTLLTGLAALGCDIRPAIESIASLLAQYWVPLDMGARGAMPQVPCDTRWASYITSTVSMLRVWAHAGDAVSQMLERQKGRSPPWAITLSQLLQDNSLLLRLSVVAVVGESFLVPELMWASKDDGLHAFEL